MAIEVSETNATFEITVNETVSPITVTVETAGINAATQTALDAKQDVLVSGTNIKTINSESILGAGNIEIVSGGGTALTTTYDNADSNLTATNVKAALDELDADISAISGDFQGDLAIADTPTLDGYYFATESGTYTNAGSVVSDLTAGLNVITKIGATYGIVVIPFSTDGFAKWDDILSILNSTKNTVLSIPYFDSRYINATTLINSVNPSIEFTAGVGEEGTVQENRVYFENATSYATSERVAISKRNSYMCFAYTDWGDNNTDRAIIGEDVSGGFYIQVRLGLGVFTLNIVNPGATGPIFDLPVGFDKTQPIVLQIVNNEDETQAWINGEELVLSNSPTNNTGTHYIDTIGKLTTVISRNPEGGYVYQKIANTAPTKNELNKDLSILSSFLGLSDFDKINNTTAITSNAIIWAGQSNADGRGLLTVEGLSVRPNTIQTFDKNLLKFNRFQFTTTGVNRYISPEQSLFTYSEVFTTKPIYQIRQATGGTSFAANDWNKGDGQYDALINQFLHSKQLFNAQGVTPNYVMVWIQGESDGDTPTNAAAYQAALTQFFADVRTDTGLPNLPIVIGRLSNNQTGVSELSTIQAAQDAVAALSANNYIINTDSYAVGDGLHFTEAGCIQYGYDLFDLLDDEGLLI